MGLTERHKRMMLRIERVSRGPGAQGSLKGRVNAVGRVLARGGQGAVGARGQRGLGGRR